MNKKDSRIIHKAIDGEVSKSETRILQQKMLSDGQVRQEYQDLKKVVRASGSVRIEVPPGFIKKVMKGIGPQAPRA